MEALKVRAYTYWYVGVDFKAGLNKSDTGDSSERVTPREPVEVTLGSPGQ